MTEADIVRKALKALRELPDTFWFKVHGGPYQQAGIPDIIGMIRGRFFGLEFKTPARKNTVTPLQEQTLNAIRKAGGVGAVVTSVDEALAVAKEFSPQS